VAVCHAAWRVGAPLVPFHSDWTPPEVDAARAAASPIGVEVADASEVGEWMLGSERGAHRENDPARRGDHAGRAGDPTPHGIAAIVLTSGSSGAPRPVALTHANLRASADAVAERLELRESDAWLSSLSLAHVGGLALVHRAAAVGCGLVTIPRFRAAEVARLVDEGAVTHLSAVPVTLERLIEARGDLPAPSTLRCVLVGGAAAPLALVDRAVALGYPVALTYGLTEATSQVATATPEQVRAKPGSVGRPLRGLDVVIGPEGEILVRGPTVVTTAAWLATGDLGRLDPDGDLWVTGRLSDRIVTGGVTVEPGEVEVALQRHQGVAEVAVVGEPDETWGERLVAVVVPRDPARPPSLDDLVDLTRDSLAPAKRPRGIRIVDALPRTANGKVDRARLKVR
jgi:O-succinylbenzoic acid--CoA ligase